MRVRSPEVSQLSSRISLRILQKSSVVLASSRESLNVKGTEDPRLSLLGKHSARAFSSVVLFLVCRWQLFFQIVAVKFIKRHYVIC